MREKTGLGGQLSKEGKDQGCCREEPTGMPLNDGR